MSAFLNDLRSILLQLGCILKRKHRDLRGAGQLVRKGGFRPVSLAQCRKCGAIVSLGSKYVGTRAL